jgi:predicted GNAT superfamily acetyltransferase
MMLMAYKNDEPVGFKFGYATSKDTFYSWTGGVIPFERRHGIAKELLKRQHAWCIENKFKFIEIKRRNKFPEMLALNIKSGFKIIGTFTESDGAPKILFIKELT